MKGPEMFINALAGAIDAAHPKQFDYLSRQLWQEAARIGMTTYRTGAV